MKCGLEQANARKTCKNEECGEIFPKKATQNDYWEGIKKKGLTSVNQQKNQLQYRVSTFFYKQPLVSYSHSCPLSQLFDEKS